MSIRPSTESKKERLKGSKKTKKGSEKPPKMVDFSRETGTSRDFTPDKGPFANCWTNNKQTIDEKRTFSCVCCKEAVKERL
jgi:hypothetical protein